MQQTSLDAYQSVLPEIGESQLYALRIAEQYGPHSAENLAVLAGVDPKVIWKRYPELESMGYVVRQEGDTETNPSGRQGLIIRVTDLGRKRLSLDAVLV